MWRDSGVVLLLASATFIIICAEEDSKRNMTITVPKWIRNGTEERVVLDCEYEYSLDEDKFTVKWFFNYEREAVYQWIPTMNSRMFSALFRDYADWEDQLENSDKYTKYRRIILVRPTIEFGGTYSCWVSSVFGQGSAEAAMRVYAPAKNITLTYNSLGDNQLNITCVVEKIFPKPDVQLFAESEGNNEPKPLGETSFFSKDNGIHGYDITINALVSTYELNSSVDTTIKCVVIIHDSNYQEVVKKVYHPAPEIAILEPLYEIHNKPSSSPRLVAASLICIIFAILLL